MKRIHRWIILTGSALLLATLGLSTTASASNNARYQQEELQTLRQKVAAAHAEDDGCSG